MGIKKVTVYAITCDCCGENLDEEYKFFIDLESALEVAMESDWMKHQTAKEVKYYCPECFMFDKNDNMILITNNHLRKN